MGSARKRILVVEDDAAIREMEHKILSVSRYEVVTAENGAEALRIARQEPFDLFLLDVMLPGMSGFDLARQLRQDEHASQTPILFVTARGGPDATSEGFAVGASLYLVKPFTTATLLTMVHGAMAAAA